MFFIYGWGKVTKSFLGDAMYRTCNYCNTESYWKLCIQRKWVTLFFIPVIPYSKTYCLLCPNCNSYIELNREQFEEIKQDIDNNKNSEDLFRYNGKNETQINYIKAMEEAQNK